MVTIGRPDHDRSPLYFQDELNTKERYKNKFVFVLSNPFSWKGYKYLYYVKPKFSRLKTIFSKSKSLKMYSQLYIFLIYTLYIHYYSRVYIYIPEGGNLDY